MYSQPSHRQRDQDSVEDDQRNGNDKGYYDAEFQRALDKAKQKMVNVYL
jgi:hypothetical protein